MTGAAHAKLNLALVVGPRRSDGKHELVTLFQRITLTDLIDVERAEGETTVSGYEADTLVRTALDALRAPHGWRVAIDKRIPVASGLGGGSSDAATALRLANAQLDESLPPARLHRLAAEIGADVPFFLYDGPQLARGDGSVLQAVALPQDFTVLVVLPHGVAKVSTADVYDAFDARHGDEGFDARAAELLEAIAAVRRPSDLARLPANDLAQSPLAPALLQRGAFRADVSGAGPAVYGLFERHADAETAGRSLQSRGRVWLTLPTP